MKTRNYCFNIRMIPEIGVTAHTAPGVNDWIIKDIDRELGRMDPNRKVEILDLGAGEGYITYQLLRAIDRRGMKGEVFAVDINEAKFEPKNIPGVTFRTINLDTEFHFGKFDFVIGADVIEHLRSPYGFLKNCFENLKTEGIIYLSTPNVLSISSLAKMLITGIPSFFDMNVANEHISPSPKWMIELMKDKICIELNRSATMETTYNRNIVTTGLRRKGKRMMIAIPAKPNRLFGEVSLYKIKATA